MPGSNHGAHENVALPYHQRANHRSSPALCVSAANHSTLRGIHFPPVALRKVLACVKENWGLCCVRPAIKSLLLTKPMSLSKQNLIYFSHFLSNARVGAFIILDSLILIPNSDLFVQQKVNNPLAITYPHLFGKRVSVGEDKQHVKHGLEGLKLNNFQFPISVSSCCGPV